MARAAGRRRLRPSSAESAAGLGECMQNPSEPICAMQELLFLAGLGRRCRGWLAVAAAAMIAACGSNPGPVDDTPPTIRASGQPQPLTVTEGQTASFTVSASGTAPLSYRWRRGGADIPGAT